MPMRVGEMMVIVRAEDFASRTLRRVSGELAGLSRAQVIAAKREDLFRQMSSARHRVALAESNARRLQYVREGVTLRKQLGLQMDAMERMRVAQAKVMAKGRFRKGITPTDIRAYQDAASAVRQLGLEGAIAHRRLRQIQQVVADRGAQGKGPTLANTRELRNAQRAVNALGVEGAASAARLDRLNRAVTTFDQRLPRMSSSLQRAARSASAMGDAVFSNKRHLESAYNDLNRAQRAQVAFNQALRQMPVQRAHEIAHALGGLGRTMQLFGALGTAAFGLAAREAAQFSQAVSLAATQVTPIGAGVDEARKRAGLLRKDILALARDYPFAAEEMAQATYDIFSSTNIQRIDQGMALLEAFARVGVAGQVDIQTATKASITVLNTFRGATDDVGETLNRMFSIVRFGRMRFSDFADMLPKVAASAYGAGQSLDDVAGIMAFLTRKTGDAGISATQISRAFDVLGRKEFRVGIEKLGVSIEDATGRLLPLPQVLKRIMTRWGAELRSGGKGAERFIQIVTRASDQAGKGFLSTAEARRFFRFVFADFETYLDLQDKTVKNNKEFQRSFDTMMADPGVQWQIFVARIKAGIIAIGQSAIPVFAQIGGFIAKMIDKWDSLSEATQTNAVRWGVWISVGTLVGGVLFSMVSALTSLGLMLGTVTARLIRIGAAFFGLSQLLGGTGTAGLIGRLFLMLKMLTFLAAIGTIVIGIELEQRGGGWAAVGKFLQIAGGERLLKRAGLFAGKTFGGIGRGGVAGVLTELIWPDSVSQDTAAGVVQRIEDLDKTLAGQMKQVKIDKIQRQATMIFQKALRIPGADINDAKLALQRYFMSIGIGAEGAGKKTKNATESFAAWEKQLTNIMGKAGSQAFLKAFGLDENSLEAFDDQADAIEQSSAALSDWRRNLEVETTRARDTAVSNLRSMYTDMEQINREAFGELFQGPWLTSETFDIAKEWGITPGIQDMITDLKQQNQQFTTWRNSLDKLMKRGLPREFIKELRAMGPEAGQSLVNEILAGKPGQVNALIAEWKRKNAQIKQATKMDFTSEINAFKKAGGDMGNAIINGFREAGVNVWFDAWVSTTFPAVIDAAVNKAIADYVKLNPRPKIPATTKPPNTGSTGGSGKGNSSTDNSKTVNVTVNMSPDARDANEAAKARRTGHAVANKVKGAMGK